MEISSPVILTNQRSPARLSLLSSDIEEDLGFIDINDSKFDYIARDEYWLLNDDEYNLEIQVSYETVLEWLESYPKTELNDNCLKVLVKNNNLQNNTPGKFVILNKILIIILNLVNGFNRFEYLTKSVSRTATITKRKIDIYNEDMATPPCVNINAKYGTITKGTLSRPFLNSNDRAINRTFDIPNSVDRTTNRTFDIPNSIDRPVNRTYDGAVLNERTANKTYEVFKMPNSVDNDESDNNSTTNQVISVNTNTITKSSNRRTLANVRPCPLNFDAFDSTTSDSNANNTEFEDSESMDSDGHVTDNNDLKNRLYESDKIPASRNYPTISRNITRTLLRREASQGNLNNRKLKPVYAVSSNDDLLSSTDCSTISLRSNLSSISGRSEPNLIDAQSSLKSSTQQLPSRLAPSKFQSRLICPSQTNISNGSNIRSKPNHNLRLGRPTTTNGTNIANKKMIHQAVANNNNNNNYTSNSKAHSFANMNSFQSNQYNMPRTVSQVSFTLFI